MPLRQVGSGVGQQTVPQPFEDVRRVKDLDLGGSQLDGKRETVEATDQHLDGGDVPLPQQELRVDIDGTIAPTDGERKAGMDMSYKGVWGSYRTSTSLTPSAFDALSRVASVTPVSLGSSNR